MESAWKSLRTASTQDSASTPTTSTSPFESSTSSSQTTSIQVVSLIIPSSIKPHTHESFATYAIAAFADVVRGRACVYVRPCATGRSTAGKRGARGRLKNTVASPDGKREVSRSRLLSFFSVRCFVSRFFFVGQIHRRGGTKTRAKTT